MLSLNNIRMTASAVKFYISLHLSEMFFVVECYSSFREDHLRFHEAFVMTSRLQTIFIRDIGEGSRIVSSREVQELTGYGLHQCIFMALQAWHLIVSGGLPFFIKRSNEMACLAIFRRIERYSISVIKKTNNDKHKKEYDYQQLLIHVTSPESIEIPTS